MSTDRGRVAVPTNAKSRREWIIIVISISVWAVAQLMWWANFGTTDTKLFIDMLDDQSRMGLLPAYGYYNLYYPPLTAIVFYPLIWLIDYTNAFYSADLKAMPIKVLIFVFYQLSWVALVWLIASIRTAVRRQVLYLSLLFVLNAYFFESAIVLSYLDILGLPALLLFALAMYKKAWYVAGGLFAVALMFKLLPLLVLPLVVVYSLPRPFQFRWMSVQPLIRFCLGLTTIILPLVLIFSYANVYRVLQVNFGHSTEYLSFAFNYPQLLKHWLGLETPAIIFQLLRYSFYAIVLGLMTFIWAAPRRLHLLFDAATAVFFAYFTFLGGVHENHLFLAVVFALLAYLLKPNRARLVIYILISILAWLNLFIPYGLGLATAFNSYKHLIYFLPFVKPYSEYIHLTISLVTTLICIGVLKRVLLTKPQPESVEQ
jgi:hypothetical protein